MTKIDSTRIVWLVQARLAYGRKWITKARFERRQDARERAIEMRYLHESDHNDDPAPGYGFGNTRVQRVVKGQ